MRFGIPGKAAVIRYARFRYSHCLFCQDAEGCEKIFLSTETNIALRKTGPKSKAFPVLKTFWQQLPRRCRARCGEKVAPPKYDAALPRQCWNCKGELRARRGDNAGLGGDAEGSLLPC